MAEEIHQFINENQNFSYQPNNQLGGGRTSYVFPGKYYGRDVAVKRIVIDFDRDLADLSLREIAILRELQQHAHIVKFWHSEDDRTGKFRYLVFELCSTNLHQYVSSPEYDRDLANESDKIRVILQLSEALQFIHSKKLIHHDIKPENILVSNNGSSVIMKWTDFGHSKRTNCWGSASMSGPQAQGTKFWRAPEIIQFNEINEPTARARCCRKSDIFSAGCVFFFFLTKGVHPYGDERENSDLERNIINGNMINENELNDANPARLIVIRMMENRLGLNKVIKELKRDIGSPDSLLSRFGYFGFSFVGIIFAFIFFKIWNW